MNTKAKTVSTASVSLSEKQSHKRRKKIYFNRKSCTAMLLSAAMLAASVSGIRVQAEEASVQDEQLGGGMDSSEGNIEGGNGDAVTEPVDPQPAVIVSFASLSAADAVLELEEPTDYETVQALLKERVPELTARIEEPVPETPPESGDGTTTDTGDDQTEEPDTENDTDMEPGADEETPDAEENLGTGDGNGDGTEGGSGAGIGDGTENGAGAGTGDGTENDSGAGTGEGTEGGSGTGDETGGSTEGGADTETGGDNSSDSGTTEGGSNGTEGSGEGDAEPEAQSSDIVMTEKGRTLVAGEGHSWRLLVSTDDADGDNADTNTDNGDTAADTNTNDNIDGANDNNGSGSAGTDNNDNNNENNNENNGENPDPSEPKVEIKEIQIPVTWVCDEYKTAYEASDQEGYKYTNFSFRPEWDESQWVCRQNAENGETIALPSITVRYAPPIDVSDEDTLRQAFEDAAGKTVTIRLNADISLTDSLAVPYNAVITLDGQGHSLCRGRIEDGTDGSRVYDGIMILMDGELYGRDQYGILTLKDVTVDGKTSETAESNRACAPAVMDWGHLILEKDAVIRSNANYGTYTRDEEGNIISHDIDEYGGAVQVHGMLTVTENSLVTGNFADMYGGGVYLAGGSTLYLYADVIKGNTVPEETGRGADIYADRGSTIYYAQGIDMSREGFWISEGATLIQLWEQGAEDNRPDYTDKEVYISVSKDSGYTEADLIALKAALSKAPYNYRVLTNRTYINTTDLRDWSVYDHYDTRLWPETVGETERTWATAYQEYKRRPYYACTETNAEYVVYRQYNEDGTITQLEPPDMSNPKIVKTIQDWLVSLRNGDYGGTNNPKLAQFKEHIYSRDEAGSPTMTFAGYGVNPYIDFLFYDPESDGEKVVDFDVNSSMVQTHTLAGTGFLVNVGTEGSKGENGQPVDGAIKGYLVYYTYTGNKATAKANKVAVYKIKEGVTVGSLHGGAPSPHTARRIRLPRQLLRQRTGSQR